MRNKGSLPQ